jgi:FixJ family two-component response regulator
MTDEISASPDVPCVFIIDDSNEVRRSLERLVRSAGLNVETFASAQDFLQRAPYAGTGCVMLDVRMPGMNGPELHEQLARFDIHLPVVYLTGYGDVPTSVKAMKDGAVDFLLKPVDDVVLLSTVSGALARHAAQRAGERERRQSQARLERLSSREREVMECVIAGLLNKQIAYDLGISEKTVKAHRGRVMEKVEVRSVAELVRLCEAVGIRPRPTVAMPGRPLQASR